MNGDVITRLEWYCEELSYEPRLLVSQRYRERYFLALKELLMLGNIKQYIHYREYYDKVEEDLKRLGDGTVQRFTGDDWY